MVGVMRTFTQCIGDTPLIQLQRMHVGRVSVLCKLEGMNPGGSVKDRPVLSMIEGAERLGILKTGDCIIEATSGNTGIALAMMAAARGYRLILCMPKHASEERKMFMRAYGAELMLVDGSMEDARDLAMKLVAEGRGQQLNQFANPDNPKAHYGGTGPEIWRDSAGRVSHFVSSTGTTGTVVGAARYLKEQNNAIRIIAVRPAEGEDIPGIRKWPKEYEPAFFDPSVIDEERTIRYSQTREICRRLAREEGLLVGPSSGGNVYIALQIAAELERNVDPTAGQAAGQEPVVVAIICDRGERYFSTDLFD